MFSQSALMVRFVWGEETLPRFGLLNTTTLEVVEVLDAFHPDMTLNQHYNLADLSLLYPTPCTPSKIIAVGLNYPDHIAEMKHQTVPENPVLFLKAPSALQHPDLPIHIDPDWGQVDYEGELAVIMGTPCYQVDAAEALNYVYGYTLANDVTARTLQRQDTQWGRAKNFDTFCPLGPYTLLNHGQNPSEFSIETWLDDKRVQHGSVGEMRHSIPRLIEYISHIMTLQPGDVILTGTPQGVGPLAIGQHVSVRMNEVGALNNTVALLPCFSQEAAHV